MERLSLNRVGAVCAVLYVPVLIVFFVLLGSADLFEAQGADEILPLLDEHQAAAATAAWILVVAPLLVAVAGLAFFRALRDAGTLMWVAVLAFSGGALLIIYRGLVFVAMTEELAPAYVDATGDTRVMLAVVGDTLERFAFGADLLGAALIPGIGAALFSAAILRTGFAPAWVAWVGFVAAVFGGWGTLLVPLGELFELFELLGSVAWLVWMVAMGVALWRTPDSSSSQTEAPVARTVEPEPGRS